mgnify:CR=1 FL=1
MSLNPYMRGELENLVDQGIIITPTFANIARNNLRPEFNIQTLEEKYQKKIWKLGFLFFL